MQKNTILVCKWLYTKLVSLYPRAFRERFSQSMVQTFNDLLRDRQHATPGLLKTLLWLFFETMLGILRTHAENIVMTYKDLIRLVLLVVSLLMVPLVAMQFSDEVVWTGSDFVIAAMLLLGSGLLFLLARRLSNSRTSLAAFGVAIFTGLLLIWVNLAVGLIGSEDNPANLLYMSVLATPILGALAVRLSLMRMPWVMITTAIAQFLVPIIAILVFKPPMETGAQLMGVMGVLVANGLFVALWLLSAWLFKLSSRRGSAGLAHAEGEAS